MQAVETRMGASPANQGNDCDSAAAVIFDPGAPSGDFASVMQATLGPAAPGLHEKKPDSDLKGALAGKSPAAAQAPATSSRQRQPSTSQVHGAKTERREAKKEMADTSKSADSNTPNPVAAPADNSQSLPVFLSLPLLPSSSAPDSVGTVPNSKAPQGAGAVASVTSQSGQNVSDAVTSNNPKSSSVVTPGVSGGENTAGIGAAAVVAGKVAVSMPGSLNLTDIKSAASADLSNDIASVQQTPATTNEATTPAAEVGTTFPNAVGATNLATIENGLSANTTKNTPINLPEVNGAGAKIRTASENSVITPAAFLQTKAPNSNLNSTANFGSADAATTSVIPAAAQWASQTPTVQIPDATPQTGMGYTGPGKAYPAMASLADFAEATPSAVLDMTGYASGRAGMRNLTNSVGADQSLSTTTGQDDPIQAEPLATISPATYTPTFVAPLNPAGVGSTGNSAIAASAVSEALPAMLNLAGLPETKPLAAMGAAAYAQSALLNRKAGSANSGSPAANGTSKGLSVQAEAAPLANLPAQPKAELSLAGTPQSQPDSQTATSSQASNSTADNSTTPTPVANPHGVAPKSPLQSTGSQNVAATDSTGKTGPNVNVSAGATSAQPSVANTADLTSKGPIISSNSANSAVSASKNAGTGVANMDLPMKNQQNTNEVAGPDVKDLPVGNQGSAGEKILATRASAAPVRIMENHGTDLNLSVSSSPNTSPTAGNAQVVNVADLPSLVDGRLRAVDRANDMIALHSMRLVESKSDMLSVVIKPAVGTELSLELRQSSSGVEAHATLMRGDHQFLSEHWNDLQQRLEQRGIRLAPLGSDTDFSASDNSSFQRRQSSDEEAAQQASAFAEFAAVNPTVGGATARYATVHDGWESWA